MTFSLVYVHKGFGFFFFFFGGEGVMGVCGGRRAGVGSDSGRGMESTWIVLFFCFYLRVTAIIAVLQPPTPTPTQTPNPHPPAPVVPLA